METFPGISKETLGAILHRIQTVRVAVVGDICLDVYWKADMKRSELSRETPHHPLPVVDERVQLGAAGNVAVNSMALRPGALYLAGVVGNDWRGALLREQLALHNLSGRDIITSAEGVTNAYCKPIRMGVSGVEYEDPRLDFNNHTPLGAGEEEQLLATIDRLAGEVDVLCVSDQLPFGCITPRVRERVVALAAEGLRVIVDSRDRIGLFKGALLKPNEVEGLRAVRDGEALAAQGLPGYAAAAKALAAASGAGVCMTLGAAGCLYAEGERVTHIPSHMVVGPIDICGAGDTFLSAFALAIAAGAQACEAAALANLAADISIQKIGETGVAAPEQIVKRQEEIALHRRAQ